MSSPVSQRSSAASYYYQHSSASTLETLLVLLQNGTILQDNAIGIFLDELKIPPRNNSSASEDAQEIAFWYRETDVARAEAFKFHSLVFQDQNKLMQLRSDRGGQIAELQRREESLLRSIATNKLLYDNAMDRKQACETAAELNLLLFLERYNVEFSQELIGRLICHLWGASPSQENSR